MLLKRTSVEYTFFFSKYTNNIDNLTVDNDCENYLRYLL